MFTNIPSDEYNPIDLASPPWLPMAAECARPNPAITRIHAAVVFIFTAIYCVHGVDTDRI